MAHQVPHQVPVQDDEDITQLSTPGLGDTPHTLSFINNVQSAVAQIEHRLATSPSAHPLPLNPHELAQSPPGPSDPVINRVQFPESSLSIPPSRPSKHASLADSAFAEAINPDTSLVSSGAIISTTPPSTLTSNPCTQEDDHHTSQPEAQTSSASDPDTTERGVDSPVPSIAPIVEQFETPIAPSFTKEQDAAIAAAPIAPIVEHFEISSQSVEKTDNTHTIEASDERVTTPFTEQFDSSAVDDKPVLSSSTGSGDGILEVKATTSEKCQTSSDNGSEPVEHGIHTEDIPAGVPTVCHAEHDNATDESSVETRPSTQDEAHSASPVADEVTPVPIVDENGQITDQLGKATVSDGVQPETDTTSASAGGPSEIGESDTAATSQSCDKDHNSQSFANVSDEETKVSEEDTDSLRKRTVSGEMSKDASPDTTQQESEADIGQTNLETTDVTVPSVISCEECDPDPSLGGEKSIPCEFDNSVVMEQGTASNPVAISSQADCEAGAPSTKVLTSDTISGGIETPTILPVHPSMDPGSLKVAMASSGSELNSNEGTLDAAVGDTSVTEPEEQSENHVGQALNITRTSEGDTHVASATGNVNMDDSTVTETTAAVRDAVESVTEREASCEYKEQWDSAEPSGSPPDNDESSDANLGPLSRKLADRNTSLSEETNAKDCVLQENSEEVAPKVSKCEQDTRLEEVTTGLESRNHLSQENTASANTGNGTAVISKDKPTSPVHTEQFIQTSPSGDQGLNEREVMAAKAALARDKLAKFSLGSPVKKPHRGPFTRKTGDGRESSMRAARTAPVSPGIRRSPTSSPKKSSFSPPKLAAPSATSPILEETLNSPKQRKLRSPSASLRGADAVLTGLPPRQSPIQKGRVQSPRQKRMFGYTGSENKDEKNAPTRVEQSPLQLSQPSSDKIPRLPRVAGLAPARSITSRTPHSMPKTRARTRIPRASTFSATVPRSKTTVSSPVLGRRGIASSPVTPTADEKASSTPRPPLRRALSFTQSKPSSTSFSPVSRPLSSRSRESDASSTLSLSASGSKPPRGARARFTVPEPFALAGPELQEKTEKQMEEARRKLAEAEARPRVFKPRPMPDFSKPYPRPHK